MTATLEEQLTRMFVFEMRSLARRYLRVIKAEVDLCIPSTEPTKRAIANIFNLTLQAGFEDKISPDFWRDSGSILIINFPYHNQLCREVAELYRGRFEAHTWRADILRDDLDETIWLALGIPGSGVSEPYEEEVSITEADLDRVRRKAFL